MGKIEYRNYKLNDEKSIANLYKKAFQSHGVGIDFPSKEFLWRFIQNPISQPEEIQIAFDPRRSIVVGTIFSTIEDLKIDGVNYTTGSINDVAVLPGCRGKGIAKKLIEQAITFMKSKNCDFSTLMADPKGHARLKLYIPKGWKDIIYNKVFLFITPSIYKNIRFFLLFSPILKLIYHLQMKKLRILENELKNHNFIIDTIDNFKSKKIYEKYSKNARIFFNRVAPKQMDGFISFKKEIWNHYRIKTPFTDLQPTYVMLYHSKTLIGYASFLKQNFSMNFIGKKIPMAIIREIIIDNSLISNKKKNLPKLYSFLIKKVLEIAMKRNCHVVLASSTNLEKMKNSAMKQANFLELKGGVFMVRNMKEKMEFKDLIKKPLRLNPAESFHYP